MDAEQQRLEQDRRQEAYWKKWGPYLSERQWGTVREDYGEGGDAWNYFPHEHARSRVYRWGEDGIAGLSDDQQRLCFSLTLWNGRDAILKERLFGLTNGEGNHGEDVKEYYFYLDSTPTHSYMKLLYKYPQESFPYYNIVATNRQRSREEFEYELLDTGIFNEDRYFDVFVEYAKADAEDILIRITACNRGPEAATLHLLPTLWFRNTWSWGADEVRPSLRQRDGNIIEARHEKLGTYLLHCEPEASLLFTENETNNERLFGTPNVTPYVKDGFNEYLINQRETAVNAAGLGTKAAAYRRLELGSGASATIRLRLTDASAGRHHQPLGEEFEAVFATRQREADDFYRALTPSGVGDDVARVVRQALAGMLWSKQYYYFDAEKWLSDHGAGPLQAASRPVRNRDWFHMINENVISMPDKWEYPWYAAWDLAFHALVLAIPDIDFAKQQIEMTLRARYLHPNGQIPAYEWNFSDVNPPVHAWAAIYLYRLEQMQYGQGDIKFLARVFSKLMLNFTWWVNRKDRFGRNIFEGGFLGLDNIGVFDRSAPLPTGGALEQADGTAWMALFCQNMLEMSVEIATRDPVYEDLAVKFTEHFLWIAAAMNQAGSNGMWDEEDGFYYDLLRFPDGNSIHLKVRSVVGLLPLCAVTVFEPQQRHAVPRVVARVTERLQRMPELLTRIHPTGPGHRGVGDRGIIALVGPDRLRRILARMLDEDEFLSPYGIRALSRYHATHPYVFTAGGQEHRVDYLPAESNTSMFGGNSNWRGPIWFPINALILRGLLQYYLYYGDGFKVECPTGSGNMMNLFEVAQEIILRLTRIFLRDTQGRRPVHGGAEKFQNDPHWRDLLLFYEYFHGDNGAGIGASHQTGWTGLVAPLIKLLAVDPKLFLEAGSQGLFGHLSARESAKGAATGKVGV